MNKTTSIKFRTLKWLFIFQLLVALGVCSVWQMQNYRRSIDRRIVNRLEAAGAHLRASHTFHYWKTGDIQLDHPSSGTPPPSPDCQQVTGLFIRSDWNREAVLRELHRLPNLELVYLENTDASDSDMAYLAKLKSVRMIDLEKTQITDSGLMQLAQIKSLSIVVVGRTKVTGAGLDAFRKLRPDVNVVTGYR